VKGILHPDLVATIKTASFPEPFADAVMLRDKEAGKELQTFKTGVKPPT